MSDRGLAEWSTLEILSESDDEYDPTMSDESSGGDIDLCYFCECILDFEENEFYDPEEDRYYCERCWGIHLEELSIKD
jgi:hypothetical protein